MGLLREADREGLRQELAKLTTPVKLVFFSQALNCEYCPLTKQVLEEITSLTDKVILQEYNFAIDREVVAQYHIARVPAIAIVRLESPKVLVPGNDAPREVDYGIRYYGVPAGFEFAALIGDIVNVSAGESGLSEQSKTALKQLKDPLHLQVFTTPT
jgi:alkyl hydroperoxide reductase subunit AhpF